MSKTPSQQGAKLHKVHEAPLFHVTKYTGPYNVEMYRISAAGDYLDFSKNGMIQLARFMEDFQRENADANFEKRPMYAK